MRKLSYDPLLKKLIDAKLSKTELTEKARFSRITLEKIEKNETVAIDACNNLSTNRSRRTYHPSCGHQFPDRIFVADRKGEGDYSLSKQHFADAVSTDREGFIDFDFSEFDKIFKGKR